MELGEKIKEIRIERGLTQKELATRLSTTQQNLAQYESGKRKPKLETLDKIAQALNYDVWDLYQYYNLSALKSNDCWWSLYLEDKLKQIGCKLAWDEEDAAIWIEFPDGTLEVTSKELKELDDSTVSYLQFKLEELKKNHPKDFRPRK